MRLFLIVAIGVFVSACATGGGATRPQPEPELRPVTLPDTFEFDLDSLHTGRTHRMYVSVPEGPAPVAGRPVLFLLDGGSHFASLDRLARTLPRLSRGLGVAADAPIIVGLTYPGDGDAVNQARGEDYTPPARELADTGDRYSKKQGGADRFLDFVKRELEPTLAERLPIDRTRTALMGHSYGGLLVLHALFTRPDAFHTFVAGSPSIWWNGRHVLNGLEPFRARFPDLKMKPRVLIAVGSLEQTPRKSAGERGGAVVERRMVDNAREVAEALSVRGDEHGLEVLFVEFPGEDHYSAWLPLMNRGLLFFVAPALLPGA